MTLPFDKNQHFHILGSCGTLMAGLCQLALDSNLQVSGSDACPSPPMSDLLPQTCQYRIEDKKYLQADTVVVGNVFKYDSPVIEQIRQRNIPMISSMDFLAHLIGNKKVIAVCGTHGKSTTTSLVTWILESAGLNPSYLIGAHASNFSHSARLCQQSAYFVIEADEYDISFFDKRSKMQTLWPEYILANTIEFDHADIFRTQEDVFLAFEYFMRRVNPAGKIFALDDLPKSLRHFNNLNLIRDSTPVFSSQGEHLTFQGEKVHPQKNLFGPVTSNLMLAYALAQEIGITDSTFGKALSTFQGVKRRSWHYQHGETDFWVDFAHHPTAIHLFIQSLSSGKQTPFYVLIEKGSNSMQSGVFDDRLSQIVQNFPWIKFYWMNKAERTTTVLEEFVNRCIIDRTAGIIMTNNPYRWSQIQCVFSMHNQEA